MDQTSRDNEIKNLKNELDMHRLTHSKAEMNIQIQKNQIKALGKTIDRLRSKKGKIDSGIKTCVVC